MKCSKSDPYEKIPVGSIFKIKRLTPAKKNQTTHVG